MRGGLPCDAAVRRKFRRSALLGGVPSLAVFAWLLTFGTFKFVSSGFTNNFYDVQALSLLHGRLSMPPSALFLEGFATHGRSYMYFGPTLAVVRLPFMAIAPQLAGKLTDLSMVAAFVVLLCATSAFLLRARILLRPTADQMSTFESVTVAVTVFCVGSGSVVLFLAGFPSVYQETELWAIALVLTGAVLFLDLVSRPTPVRSAVFGLVVLAAFMTRASVGSALVVLAAGLTLTHGVTAVARHRKRPDPSWLRPIGLSLHESSRTTPVLFASFVILPVVLYVWINEAKFGTLVTVPFDRQGVVTLGLATKAYRQVVMKDPTLSGFQYLPTTVSWYLRPDALSLSTLFPFVDFPQSVSTVDGARFALLSPTTSVTASMPALTVLAAVGTAAVVAPRRLIGAGAGAAGAVRFRPVLLAGVVGSLVVFTFATIANRYLGDLLPFFLFAALIAAALLPGWLEHRSLRLRVAVSGGLVVLVAWSCWVNAGLGLLDQRSYSQQASLSQRTSFVAFRQGLHRSTISGPSPGVTWGGPRPQVDALGDLYVDGACRSLSEWNGTGWVGIEWSAAAGHAIVEATVPSRPTSRPLPLLTRVDHAGTLDMLGLRVLPKHRFEIAYVSLPGGGSTPHLDWQPIARFPTPPSGTAIIDLVMHDDPSPALRSIAATLLPATATATAGASGPAPAPGTDGGYTVGGLPRSLRADPGLLAVVEPSYPEALHQLPVTTPICDSLAR